MSQDVLSNQQFPQGAWKQGGSIAAYSYTPSERVEKHAGEERETQEEQVPRRRKAYPVFGAFR